MSGRILPGPTLLPGEPRYESLAAEFSSREFVDMTAGRLPQGHRFKMIHPIANLLPMMKEEERTSFRASLAERQNHPVIFHVGLLADGRNRARELIELKKPISSVVFEGSPAELLKYLKAENIERRHLTFEQRVDYASRVARIPVGANQHTMGSSRELPSLPLVDENDNPPPIAATETVMTQKQAADEYGVSTASIKRYNVVLDKGAPELQNAVQQGEVTVNDAMRVAVLPIEEQRAIVAAADPKLIKEAAKKINKEANDARRAERMDKLKSQSAGNTPLSTAQKFPVIYMDPPTKFAAGDSNRSTENHYPTMDEEQLAGLPISDLALSDCVLFIWTTVPWLRKTIRLLEGWGFEYVSEFVWEKQALGLGFWNRNAHETLLVATRGKIPAPVPSALHPSFHSEKRGDHSAKPEYFRSLITAYYPDLPKVELFSRVDGELPQTWTAWGNEARVPKQQSLGVESAEAAE